MDRKIYNSLQYLSKCNGEAYSVTSGDFVFDFFVDCGNGFLPLFKHLATNNKKHYTVEITFQVNTYSVDIDRYYNFLSDVPASVKDEIDSALFRIDGDKIYNEYLKKVEENKKRKRKKALRVFGTID